MQIQTSLDWEKVGTELTVQLNRLPYNNDLKKLIHNIDIMIVDLSKAEVKARRIHKPEYTKDKVDKINKAIDQFEKWLLIAELMK